MNQIKNIFIIKVHPGANHGTGPTDITLTLRNAIHIIEFKKDVVRSKVRHGLEVQLPLYMESAGAAHGSYVVLCHDHDPEYVSRWLPPAEGTPAGVAAFLVDCRVRKSASKA